MYNKRKDSFFFFYENVWKSSVKNFKNIIKENTYIYITNNK